VKNNPKWYLLLLIGFILLLASSLLACDHSTPPSPPSSSSHPTIAASPSSFTFISEQGAPNPSSQTLQIQNSGDGTLDWSATGDAAWLSLSPTSGSCSAEETNNIAVSVDASATIAGDYTATITISAPEATNTPQTVAVNLTITPITPTVTYSVSVAISPGSQTSFPGDTLDYYTITITNTGTEADTYDLGISDDQGWTLTYPSATSEIDSGESESITVSLTIPEDTASETEDEIAIIATSQNDPTASDSTTCTAVVMSAVGAPSVSIDPATQMVEAGSSFSIDVVVDSVGTPITACNVVVTFDADLTATGLTGADLLGAFGIDAFYIPLVDVGEFSYGAVRIGDPIVPIAVDGNFVTINFEVDAAAAGTYDLIIEATLRDANGDPIAVVENDGEVIIVQ
jgi:hypothetical protein